VVSVRALFAAAGVLRAQQTGGAIVGQPRISIYRRRTAPPVRRASNRFFDAQFLEDRHA
jgi:hypothetical protein